MTMINFRRLLVLSVFTLQLSCGQTGTENNQAKLIPFTADNWTVENEDETAAKINALTYKKRSALKLEPNQKAYLKNKKFKNFELEFYCEALSGPGLRFRVQDRLNYEYLYLRLGLSGKKDAMQYVPTHNGNLPWQLYNYPMYEGKAVFPRKKVASFPLAFKKELVEGKANEKLISALAEKGLSYSKETIVVFADETTRYIFDSEEKKGLLFEEVDKAIVFLDIRTWIHIKVAVIEDRATFYVEDMETPVFVVENLKRDAVEGGISLIGDGGDVYFADLTIQELPKAMETGSKPPKKRLSANYLTKWSISEMFAKDSIHYRAQLDSLFRSKSKFKPIEADADGLINISRFYDDMTKTVALNCTLVSEADQTVRLNFDYADHLVALLNSQLLFDKGMDFAPPEGKGEEGRVFVNDESVELHLKKGANQLIFILSADSRQKFNWGFIAKLEHLNGISLE